MNQFNMRFVSYCCVPVLATLLLSMLSPGKLGFQTLEEIAQNKKVDSLLIVKDYLLQIQSAIPADSNKVKQKIIQLQGLVRQGSFQQEVLERQITALKGNNAEDLKEIVQKFRFIVQSAALLRTDLQQTAFSSASVQQEIRYLHKHIPPLAHQIHAIARSAKDNKMAYTSLEIKLRPDL